MLFRNSSQLLGLHRSIIVNSCRRISKRKFSILKNDYLNKSSIICNIKHQINNPLKILKYSTQFSLPEIDEAKKSIKNRQYGKADLSLQRAYDIAKLITGENSKETCSIIALRSYCQFHMKNYSNSIKLFESYIRTMLSNNSKLTPDVLLNLCIVYSHQQQWDKGIELLDLISNSSDNLEMTILSHTCRIILVSLKYHYSQSKDIDLTSLLDNTDTYLSQVPKDSFSHLYLLYTIQKLKNYMNSSTESEVFLNIVETIDALDPKSLDSKMELLQAECLVNLGYDHYKKGQYSSSEEFFRRAVDLTDRYFDRDDDRVRRVIERAALTQCALVKWLQAEGLMRRLIDYYESIPLEDINTINIECMEAYCRMMDIRGRGNETTNAKKLLEKVNNPKPIAPFDIDTFYISQLQ